MTRDFPKLSILLFILTLVIGFSGTHAAGELKEVSLAVEGMV